MNNFNTIADLRNYVGEFITYKTPKQSYKLRISDVTKEGMKCYEPTSGATATIPLEKAAELIRVKNLKG